MTMTMMAMTMTMMMMMTTMMVMRMTMMTLTLLTLMSYCLHRKSRARRSSILFTLASPFRSTLSKTCLKSFMIMMMVMMMKFYGQPVLKHYWLLPGLRFVHFSSLSSQPSLPVLILVSVKKMLESRPEDALVNTVNTVKTVETVETVTVETVTVETVGRDCR